MLLIGLRCNDFLQSFVSLTMRFGLFYRYSSVLAKNGSHKYIAPNRPWLLQKYYGSRGNESRKYTCLLIRIPSVMLFSLCFAQEAVLVLMYLYHFATMPTAAAPVWMQQAVFYAAVAFFPIALLKQVIVVHTVVVREVSPY